MTVHTLQVLTPKKGRIHIHARSQQGTVVPFPADRIQKPSRRKRGRDRIVSLLIVLYIIGFWTGLFLLVR